MELALPGLWILESWHKVLEDGQQLSYTASPIGGFLSYSNEGFMAVSIYERDPARLLSSYAGRYESFEGEVIHHPIEGSSPYGIQDKKVRRVQIEQKRMIMETTWTDPNNAGFIHRLVWRKTS